MFCLYYIIYTMPTIDDMMLISDGHDPFHYIKGKGIKKDKNGNNKWTNFSTPKDWKDSSPVDSSPVILIKKVNLIKNYLELIQKDIEDLEDNSKKDFKDKLHGEIVKFQDTIKGLIIDLLESDKLTYKGKVFKEDYIYNKIFDEVTKSAQPILQPLINDVLKYVKPISPEQAVPYVEKIMDDNEERLIDILGVEGYEEVKEKLEEDPLTDLPIYNLKKNNLFFNASDFESKISGLKTDLLYKEESLQKPEFNYMRHIIETLDPYMKDVVNSKGVTIKSLNTNFNVKDPNSDNYIWFADEYYWIDSIWEITVGKDEIFRYAVEYKYYTNNEDVVYNYGKQINYINSIKDTLEEKSKKMEEKEIFQSSKNLSIVMSASKMGFDIENLNIENLEYKAMVLGMLGSLKQTPIIDKNDGKINEIRTQIGGLNSKETQDKLLKGATILFVVAMQDTIIGLNYSDAIKDKKISLNNPLETTKLTFSAYSNKKNRKVKSIGLSPTIFTPIKIGIVAEEIEYNKTNETKAINEFVDEFYKNENNNYRQQQKSRMKAYLFPESYKKQPFPTKELIAAWNNKI